ncbi:MAG: GGDEF domain-containing protein [Aliidiomarina sp.]|uniref:GGDEF domain-containing protein n=1 Tax=Aliidiomarina sp. TaxID=1872439 RepID=UPI0025BB78BB|nr:GGDEF domain-containing protein [Aliidiomarina sp.]MCH8500747.1 GGDEF domain-containing protein [Aliidiomarina sp.]
MTRIQPLSPWQSLLIIGLLVIALYVMIPYGEFAGLLYVVITAAASVSVFAAVRQQRPLFRGQAWLYIASALALAAIGHIIWFWLDLYGLEPVPSLADAFYLAVYPLFILALWTLGRHRGRSDGALTDAVIVGVAAAVPAWSYLIAPYLEANLALTQLIVLTAYPVADLVVLPLIIRLIFINRSRILSHYFLLIGMLAYLAADMLYAHGNSSGWYLAGGLTDGLWLTAYLFIAVAVWHPSATKVPEDHASAAEMSSRRLLVLSLATVMAPVVILFSAGADVLTVRVAAFVSIILFLLVIYRMAGLIRKTHEQADKLEQLTRIDPLTQAGNRRFLDEVLSHEMYRAQRLDKPLTVAFADLDRFKAFNDQYGHAEGDALLVELVANWSTVLRQSDRLARIGGEEFVVVLPETSASASIPLLERMRRSVPRGQTCSVGVTELRPGDTPEGLIARADQAMYRAKQNGRDQIVSD